MAKLSELNFTLRAFLRAYRWRKIDPVPGTSRAKPLSECRVALVSSAGLVEPGDEPFSDEVRGGDWSYRLINSDAMVQELEEYHRSDSFDHAGIESDRNLGLPLERLRELAEAGEIGEIAPRHVSLMGSITAPARLIKQTAPAVGQLLVEDAVDVALMIPL